ncbi:hypothetical protein BKA62DRAFT_509569 [Auriculariales sp. MPI-PUGE-AT-0066]|nr:hypothetical protein BKA62DRAFT_509569 [Auriculariales sp. MPI-PUGE-AT-0066]
MLQALPNYLKARSNPKAWRHHLASIFHWAFSHSDTLGLSSNDERAIRLAYWCVFCQNSRTPRIDSVLLPFVTSPNSVQSCKKSEVDSALHLICQYCNHRSWSGGLEELMFHLLERRTALGSLRDRLGPFAIWIGNGPHGSVVEAITQTPSIDNFLQETTLNVLRQRPATVATTTSTWRLYLSMRNNISSNDASSGWKLAIALALLSRVGLEGSRARALLHELAGDDRGIQLLLGGTHDFVQLAIHAKTVDPVWWIDMKRRILHLPLALWDSRRLKGLHFSQQAVVDSIESSPPCKECAAAILELRRILSSQPPEPAVTFTPVDSVRMVEGADETRPGTSLPIAEALFSSASSSRYGGAVTEVAAAEQQDRTGSGLWARAITTIRAVARLAAPLRPLTSDLEMHLLTDQERVETDV